MSTLPPRPSGSRASAERPVRSRGGSPSVEAKRSAAEEVADEETSAEVAGSWIDRWVDRAALGGLFVSFSVHGFLLLILALIIIQPPPPKEILSLLVESSTREAVEKLDSVAPVAVPEMEPVNINMQAEQLLTPDAERLQTSPLDIDRLDTNPLASHTLRSIPKLDLSSDFGGRSQASREQLVELFGGTPESEQAVERGLRWLAERQRQDGSWSFDHRRPRDRHQNHQAGSLSNCPIGATAMALMCFLGAGETQNEGRYTTHVQLGLNFLLQNAVQVPEGHDLRGRNGDQVPSGNYPMYAHGLATIALCECYAMTRDRRIRPVAQGALNFLLKTRNPEVGGWRYRPEQAGDLSVTGWMIMALQSGKTAGLRVSNVAFKTSEAFLESVAHQRGSRYGYTAEGGPKVSTTSIGLLCRMYLGWDREHPALTQGVRYLSEQGPDRNNMYSNYYATQVLHHVGGATWPKWNEEMRDSLVRSQLKRGPEAGSWDVTDPHGSSGGRLYQTCLCIMTLEVYYRHLPLYQLRAIQN